MSECRVPLDPSAGALRISAMLASGEATLSELLNPQLPEPDPEPCPTCGHVEVVAE